MQHAQPGSKLGHYPYTGQVAMKNINGSTKPSYFFLPWELAVLGSPVGAIPKHEFLQKWKPQMLHLEVGHGAKMDAVLDLIEAQRMAGLEFVLVGHLQSGEWSAPAAKKILKMCLNTQVIVNQDACRYQRCGIGGFCEAQGRQKNASGSECGCVACSRGVHGCSKSDEG